MSIRPATTTNFVLSLLRLGYGVDDIRVKAGSSYRAIFHALHPARHRRVGGVRVERHMAICARRIAAEARAA